MRERKRITGIYETLYAIDDESDKHDVVIVGYVSTATRPKANAGRRTETYLHWHEVRDFVAAVAMASQGRCGLGQSKRNAVQWLRDIADEIEGE